MRRLSIVDVKGGHQPIANEDGTVHIVFNGEIYDYRALRDELVARGHRFKTRSDTETIVHQYEEDGAACVDKLDGIFAFAIHGCGAHWNHSFANIQGTVILFLGRIHPIKGADKLLDAFLRVARELEGATLAMAGPDE